MWWFGRWAEATPSTRFVAVLYKGGALGTSKDDDRVYWHVTFHPYRRMPVIWDQIEAVLSQAVEDVAKRVGFSVLKVAPMPDHVHLLLALPPWLDLIAVIGQVKGYSARKILELAPEIRLDMHSPGFWAAGYHYTKHTDATLPIVLRYLDQQKPKGGLD